MSDTRSTQNTEKMRIAKFLSHAGICSRREAEAMILDGRVSLNGQKLKTPAVKVDAGDDIRLDGRKVGTPQPIRVFLHHKQAGLLTTHKDDKGRDTVFDRLPDEMPRVISVGRLDMNTEGLLVLTTDGDLARHMEHPDTGWKRRYKVRAFGKTSQGSLDKLKQGIKVDGVKYGPIDAILETASNQDKANCWLTLTLSEGKNREVRKVLEHLGLKVNRLIRLSYGPFQLGNLEPGAVKELPPRVLKDQLPEQFRERITP